MNQQSSTWTLILCCLLGTGSGVLSSWLFGAATEAPRAHELQRAPERPSTRAGAQAASKSDASPAALKTRMDALLREQARAQSEADEEDERPVRGNVERMRAEQDAHFRDLVDSVGSEPVNPEFSARASQSFRANLQGLEQEQRFTLAGLSCHTSRCTANLRWPSFHDATERFANLLRHNYDLNCSTHTWLPEPASNQAQAAYVSTLVFDCSNLSAQL